MQLKKHVSIADKDLVEREKVVRAETEARKAGPSKEGLQTIKNLSVFSSKLFFSSKLL